MLFNSYVFIFIFLPVSILGYYLCGKYVSHRSGIFLLTLASLFFYAWWNPIYLILLTISILLNFSFGLLLLKVEQRKRLILAVSLCSNLLLLGYFKYADFFLGTINSAAGTSFNLIHVILPLGISFFTFTQIAYLVDTYRGNTKEYNLLNYILFVTFFPHLIAGPILHHKEMIPQFESKLITVFNKNNFVLGITIFAVGLFKKVIIADTLAAFANPVFAAAAGGAMPTLAEAWIGAVSYSLQLYFDFSGYSDMAIGLANMFNIKLPVNFQSPYKSKNIIEFWRKWHITLSRFLRDYLYIPLGGNRKGSIRRYINLMITMSLGGLWHGAGLTFVVWGTLHGVYLVINNIWRSIIAKLGVKSSRPTLIGRIGGQIITLIAVVIAWVFFRANTLNSAMSIVKGMAGLNGVSLPYELSSRLAFLVKYGVVFNGLTPTMQRTGGTITMLLWILAAIAIALFLPTILDLTSYKNPALGMDVANAKPRWALSPAWGIFIGTILALGIVGIRQASEFLYFQF